MAPLKADLLALAERHVRDGRAIVERQRELVDRLRRLGCSTAFSKEVLDSFERSQASFEDDLARLVRKTRR